MQSRSNELLQVGGEVGWNVGTAESCEITLPVGNGTLKLQNDIFISLAFLVFLWF